MMTEYEIMLMKISNDIKNRRQQKILEKGIKQFRRRLKRLLKSHYDESLLGVKGQDIMYGKDILRVAGGLYMSRSFYYPDGKRKNYAVHTSIDRLEDFGKHYAEVQYKLKEENNKS